MKTIYILNLKDGEQKLAMVNSPEIIYWNRHKQLEEDAPVLSSVVLTFMFDGMRNADYDKASGYPIEIDDFAQYSWPELVNIAKPIWKQIVNRLTQCKTFRTPRMDADQVLVQTLLQYLKDEEEKTTSNEDQGISQCSKEGCASCGCSQGQTPKTNQEGDS